ncbi:MAG: hypothetical protein ACXV7G_12705 [Halobacteriota archaeon]
MKFSELQRRLKHLGVNIDERTFNNWRKEGFITGPEYIPKRRRPRGRPSAKKDIKIPGPSFEWPIETSEEVAAVWALKEAKLYRTSPDPKTILRVKHKAKELHNLYTKNLNLSNLPGDEYRKDITPDGEDRTFFHSYDLQPLLVLWIVTTEKVRHNIPLQEKRLVTFHWVRETVEGRSKLVFHGVTLEESSKDEMRLNLSRAA